MGAWALVGGWYTPTAPRKPARPSGLQLTTIRTTVRSIWRSSARWNSIWRLDDPVRVPLLGDSQLVINQMTGDWGINNPALWQLNRQAAALVKGIAGGVRYRWIPREENQVADTLAGGRQGMLQTPLVYAEHPGGAAVAAARPGQIARLNQAGKMSFKEALGLRVGGMDQYSRWHLPELVTAVGAAGVALIDAAFPGQEAEAIKERETALRWMVRGLAAQLAIRKVQVDQELQANRRPDQAQ